MKYYNLFYQIVKPIAIKIVKLKASSLNDKKQDELAYHLTRAILTTIKEHFKLYKEHY